MFVIISHGRVDIVLDMGVWFGCLPHMEALMGSYGKCGRDTTHLPHKRSISQSFILAHRLAPKIF